MSKIAVYGIVVLSVVFILINPLYCKNQQIQTVFLSINNSKINPDESKPISCNYENLVEGKTTGIPDDSFLWIVVHPEVSAGFYPQVTGIIANPKNGNWAAKFWLGTRGTDIGKKHELLLVLVTKSGNQTYLSYLEQAKITGKYPEISLPEGSKTVDVLTVIKANN